MSDQPEALRLADELKERFGNTVPTSQAAAELRRQHDEIEQLTAERDALKAAAEKGTEYVLAHINQDLRAEIEKANACIRKVEVEREKVAQWMLQRSYATGHGDTTEDLLKELEWQIRESEREACAALIDANAVFCLNNSMLADVLAGNAMAIRARGKT